jgi:hypothetical protein
MASPQTALDNRADRWSPKNLARFRAKRAPRVSPERGLELGRLFIAKRDEFRGNGTRGKFTEWFREQGYTQAFVSKWIRRAREGWQPEPRKLRKDKGKGKLAANNGAAYRSRTPAAPGFIPAPTGKDLSEFDVHGATFNPISMAVPTGLSETEWMEVGRKLSTVQGASLWWVGDWVDAGFAAYGKRVAYDLAQSATGMGRGSLYCYHVVSKHFSPARRVPELTFKHHAIVATPRLTIGQQDDLLRDAVQLGLSPKQLREEVIKIIGKKPRKRIKLTIYLWPDTFVKMKELAQGKRPEWFAAEIVTDFVLAHHSDKLRGEAAEGGNLHGVDITDDDVPDFSSKGEPECPTTNSSGKNSNLPAHQNWSVILKPWQNCEPSSPVSS